MGYTTDDLLASVKLRAMTPTSQLTIQDLDIIRLANEETRVWLVPLMLEHRDSIFRTHQDQVLTTERRYRISKMAIASNVWDVVYIGPDGIEVPLTIYEESEKSGDGGPTLGYGCTIEGAFVVLTSDAPTSGTLRLYYDRLPNELVLTSQAAAITVVDAVGRTVTVSNPALFPNAAGTPVDVVKGYNPFDVVSGILASVVGSVVTFVADGFPTGVESGDHLLMGGLTDIPNVPGIIHPMLYQRLAAKVLESLGDAEGMANAYKSLSTIQDGLLNQLDVRVKSRPKVITSTELTWGY